MLRRAVASSLQRTFTSRRQYSAAYDGDASTTVSFLQQDRKEILVIASFTDYGFRLNNDSFVVGPMILFPRTALHWNIAKPDDINADSTIIFRLLAPKPDIVIIGYGNRGSSRLTPELHKHFLLNKIGIEFLPTEDAVATFNYLNGDGRLVAGGFMPLTDSRLDTQNYIKIAEKKRRLLLGD